MMTKEVTMDAKDGEIIGVIGGSGIDELELSLILI